MGRLHAAGTGYETVFVVPDGKKWKVRAISISRATGDMTLTSMRAQIGTGAVRVYTQAAASGLETDILTQDIEMEQGDVLQVRCTAVAADSTWISDTLVQEEDAF